MEKKSSAAKPARETRFPEGGPIRSASFDRNSRTLYVTDSAGAKSAYSPSSCRDNAFNYVEADFDEREAAELIRQAVQESIDEDYDGEGPHEVAHYVIIRPYQTSRKAFALAMAEYPGKVKDMLDGLSGILEGKEEIDEAEAVRFFNGLNGAPLTQTLGRTTPGRKCVTVEIDGGKEHFYTNGKMVSGKDLWYRAIPPISELGGPA